MRRVLGATRARGSPAFLPPTASVGNPVDMVASAGPGRVPAGDRDRCSTADGRRRAHRHLHAGRRDAVGAIRRRRSATASRRHARAGATRQAGARLRDGRARAPAAARRRTASGCRPTRFRRTPRARSARSPPTPSGARSRRACSGASTTSAPTRRATICRGALDARGDGWLTDEETARACCSAFGLPLAASARRAHGRRSRGAGRGARVSRSSPSCRRAGVQHKTDIGGVRLNLHERRRRSARRSTTSSTARAEAPAPRRDVDGVLIQPMIAGGVETMIGVAARSAVRPARRRSASAASTSRCSATCASASRR